MEKQNRFKVIRHRKGTRTLIDNQTGMSFWRANDEDVRLGINILIEGRRTNTDRFIENTLEW